MYRRRCKLGSFTVLTMTDMVQEIGVLKNIATVVGFPLISSEKRECLWFWLTLLVEDERPDSYRIAVFSAHTSKNRSDINEDSWRKQNYIQLCYRTLELKKKTHWCLVTTNENLNFFWICAVIISTFDCFLYFIVIDFLQLEMKELNSTHNHIFFSRLRKKCESSNITRTKWRKS